MENYAWSTNSTITLRGGTADDTGTVTYWPSEQVKAEETPLEWLDRRVKEMCVSL